MSFFDFLFGGDDDYQNPASSADRYFEQIPGTVKPYYDPLIEQGRRSSEIANPIYKMMSEDPQGFLDNLMRRFAPSEGYRFKEGKLTQQAQNAAAQGGYAGTPTAQMEQADLVRGLLGDDMQQFLSNIFGVQGAGLGGQERSIDRGAEASRGLADILAGNLAQRGNLSFQGQAQQNQNNFDRESRNANFMGDIFKTGANLLGGGAFSNLFGGGSSGGGSSSGYGRTGGAYNSLGNNSQFGRGFF